MVLGLPRIRDREVAEWEVIARGQVLQVVASVPVVEKRHHTNRESPAILSAVQSVALRW